MQRFTALVLALGATLALAAPVAAARPDRFFSGDLEDFTLDGVCAAPVLLHVTVNREYYTVTTDRTGAEAFTLVSGTLFVTVTNLDTGASVDLNASGPGRFEGDSVTAYGAYLGWHDGETGSLTLFHGMRDFNTFEGSGVATPICPLIGA